MVSEFLSGLLPFLAIVFGIGAGVAAMYFRSKKHREEQETIRLALEKGVDIPQLPEKFFRDVEAERDPTESTSSLKRGIFWTCLGAGLFIALWARPEDGIEVATWALIPLAIGIGYIIYYKMTKPNGQDSETSQ
jgi:hypothetical protein